MKSLVVIAIIFVFVIISSPSFAQAFSPTNGCPEGTKAEVRGTDVFCVKDGTNQKSGSNSQTVPQTNLQHNGEQWVYVTIGIVVLVIMIKVIAKKLQSGSGYVGIKNYDGVGDYDDGKGARRGWNEKQKQAVRIRQHGKCAKCRIPPPRWEYHHRNGDRSDNSLSNCEGLCPNCHSVKTHD